jgi:hypothetical protein
MDRREVLKTTTLLLGYTLTAGTTAAILNGCKADRSTDWQPAALSNDEIQLLSEICETILPATDTPGARDAMCERYIDNVMAVLVSEEDRKEFKEKLKSFNEVAKAKYTKSFVALNNNEREQVLEIMAKEAADMDDTKTEGNKKPHIFRAVKELTIAGYCTSEVGAKGLLKYDPIPGPYKGCINYSEVGGVWALS